MTKQEKIEKIKKLITRLRLNPSPGLTEEEIQKNEETLGLKYPEQYKEFLRMYGWLLVGEGHLGGKEGVEEALKLQKYHAKDFPKNLIPLDDNGSGDYYCLVCGGEDHGKVIFWQHDAPDEYTYPNIPDEDWFKQHPDWAKNHINDKKKDFWVEALDFWTWLLNRLEFQRQIREEF